MGVIRSTESLQAETEFRDVLLQGTGAMPWKRRPAGADRRMDGGEATDGGGIVCVTSAVSFIGFAIVHRLLSLGYSVRLALETHEDLEKLRELQVFEEMEEDCVSTVMASLTDVDSLCQAFDGCAGVFHTSSFTDAGGVSGYTKHMAEVEARAAERVIAACVRAPSVRKCVFTSSLLSCVWRRSSDLNRRHPAAAAAAAVVVDENSWSDEGLCRDKKLWFALGKTMSEKAAWRASRGRNLKLVTVCPALLTGPGFRRRSTTASIAYLKGGQDLLAEGLLATVDVNKAAEAHVRVYEAMSSTACGRYVCFDHVVRSFEEAAELERQLGMQSRMTATSAAASDAGGSSGGRLNNFELSKGKLSRLMASRRRCTDGSYIP